MALFPKYDGPPLIDAICSVQNLTLAWRRVRSNIQTWRRGRSAGIDAVTLRDYEADWIAQMTQLADDLRNGCYRPLPPLQARIPKPSGGERAIAILAVRDRVAQRAVQQVLEPLFEPLFLDCSYGCRPGIGVPEAVERVARYADQGLTWVVDADLASYFDQIDQRILLAILRQRIDELPVLHLIAQWLTVSALPATATAPTGRGSAGLALLERSGQVLQRLLAWDDRDMRQFQMPATVQDPYAVARWEAGAEGGFYPLAPAGASYPNGIGTALLLARPALAGARMALPYLRRFGDRIGGAGGRALAIGAVAAGGVALGELALRAHRAPRRGTSQGGALSPLLANIYLHPFDLALTSQGLRLVRFMDDFVIMCANQTEAERALNLAQRQLATLRLALNEDKTKLANYADGIEFLGQALAPRQTSARLGPGLVSFAEAEQALRAAARNVRGQVQRRIKR